MHHWVYIAHVAVLGYWLGSELVINSTYRYACYHDELAVPDRLKLMQHVMNVDQHVRFALALQVVLGMILAASLGYLPGGSDLIVVAAMFGAAWIAYIIAVHRLRHRPAGPWLARIDRGLRYLLIAVFLAVGLRVAGTTWPLPDWLRWKLLIFAGVITCGVAIRLILIRQFRSWSSLEQGGPSTALNDDIRRKYWQATSVLGLLWALILAILVLSVTRPVAG